MTQRKSYVAFRPFAGIYPKSIVVENADKSVVRLNAGDAMLRRIDLA